MKKIREIVAGARRQERDSVKGILEIFWESREEYCGTVKWRASEPELIDYPAALLNEMHGAFFCSTCTYAPFLFSKQYINHPFCLQTNGNHPPTISFNQKPTHRSHL